MNGHRHKPHEHVTGTGANLGASKPPISEFKNRLMNDSEFRGKLERHHDKCFGNVASLMPNQFSYRKALYEYLKGIKENCSNVSVEEAINFHKAQIYDVSSSLRAGRQGGQTPGVIIASSTSEDFIFSLFTGGIAHRTSDNKFDGAAFGPAINIRRNEHLAHTDDFISVLYMLNHLNAHKEPMVPYVLFSCSYGGSQNGLQESEVIRLAQERRAKFISAADNAGHNINFNHGKTPSLDSFGERNSSILLPLVFHDVSDCKVYVVEGGEKIPFQQWAEASGLSENGHVRAHMKNIELHEGEKEYFSSLADMMRWRKVVLCVDSRCQRENTGAVRDLGAIMSDEQRKRILLTPGIKSIPVDLHFECGYLTAAITIHEVGQFLQKLFDTHASHYNIVDAAMARKHFESQIKRIFKGDDPVYQANHQVNFFEPLQRLNGGAPLPKGVSEFLNALLVSEVSDTRNTIKHLHDRGMLFWHATNKTLSMPIASKLDSVLAAQGSGLVFANRSSDPVEAKMQFKEYCRAVILKVAFTQQKNWEKAAQELGVDVKIKVRIEDFEDGKVYYTLNGSDKYDAITNVKVL